MLKSSDSCQNRVSADRYHMTLSRAQVLSYCVYASSTDKFLVFNWSQVQDCFFNAHSTWNKLCLLASDRTSDAKSQPFATVGKAVAIEFFSLLTLFRMVTRWSHSIRTFVSQIGQNLQVSSCGIYYEAGNLFTSSWSWPWFRRIFSKVYIYKIRYICYQESFVIHGWLVFGWEMRRLTKK